MIVELSDEVFVLSERRSLLALLEMTARRDHAALHEAGADWEGAARVAALLPQLGDEDARWVRELLDRGLLEQERMDRRVRVSLVDDDWSGDVPRLGLVTAAAFVAAPLRVLMENEETDGRFLRWWASGMHATSFHRAWSRRLIDVENGGGNGTMKVLLENRRRKDRRKIHEGALLADSDRDDLARLPNATSALQRGCRRAWPSATGRWHILKRRAIENYLPIAALRDAGARDPSVVEAYARLSPALRHVFHLKVGLLKRLPKPLREANRKISPPDLPGEVLEALRSGAWASVSERDARLLFGGFGDGIATSCLGRMENGSYTMDEEAEQEASAVVGALLRWL